VPTSSGWINLGFFNHTSPCDIVSSFHCYSSIATIRHHRNEGKNNILSKEDNR